MFRHILVPLDGSEHAEKALTAARELASRFHSEVTLLRVVIPVDALLSRQRGYAAAYVEFTALAHELSEAAKVYLQDLQSSLARQGFDVDVKVVEDAQVAEAILRVVQKLDADAIVMSTHGRGGVRRWVLGSVADRVLRQATVPVVLIRATHDGGQSRPKNV